MLERFFKKYVEDTPERAVVADRKTLLCRLTLAVSRGLDIGEDARGVHITARALKHMYDKKPAEEFSYLLRHLHAIVRKPDTIYKNRGGKRGEYCLVKRLGGKDYLCSIEFVQVPSEPDAAMLPLGKETVEIQVATAFRVRNPNYMKNYTFLWSWEGGNPHRNALDAPEEVY